MRDRLPGTALVLVLVIALTLVLVTGCATTPPESKVATDTTPTRVALSDYVLGFSNVVEIAADNIAEVVTEPTLRRSTVYWKMRIIPLAQNALNNPQDVAAAVQLWVIAVMQQEAFAKSGSLSDHFGSAQHFARDAAELLQKQARELAQSILPPELFDKMEPQVDKFVRGSAMKLSLDEQAPTTWGETLTSVLKTPLDLIKAPVSSLNPTSGLSDTAVAMQNFTDEFSRARTELAYLPRVLRWQAQLLLMEAEETVNLSGMAQGVAQVGTSADSLADTAKQLPEQLRTELTAFVADLGKPQSELQATLKEANTTLTNSRETAQAIDTMGATLTLTFGAFDKLMAGLTDDPNGSEGAGQQTTTASGTPTEAPGSAAADSGPPFDINDYGRTAEKLTQTANALSALLTQTERLTEAKDPPPLLIESEASARSIINHFFMGSAALIVFWAVVAFLYRAAASRIARKTAD